MFSFKKSLFLLKKISQFLFKMINRCLVKQLVKIFVNEITEHVFKETSITFLHKNYYFIPRKENNHYIFSFRMQLQLMGIGYLFVKMQPGLRNQ